MFSNKQFLIIKNINLTSYKYKHGLTKKLFKNSLISFSKKINNFVEKKKKFQEYSNPSNEKLKNGISENVTLIEGKNILRRKKQILNNKYLESISEIIFLHENYSKLPFLNINNVEINESLTSLKIFWNYNYSNLDEIQTYLNILMSMKNDIRTSLKNNYHINTPPDIIFVYDVLDGNNKIMENIFSKLEKDTKAESFDPVKYFDKEKLLKKDFDTKSIVIRDPSVDFEKKKPTYKFKHPYEMNLYMCGLDYKKIYESILFKLSQGNEKKNFIDKRNSDLNPALYVSPPAFNPTKADEDIDLEFTYERINLMKLFLKQNRKKIHTETKDAKDGSYEKTLTDFELNLFRKKNQDELYVDKKN